MKKNYIVKLLVLVCLVVIGITACNRKNEKKAAEHVATEYTCPMHPQIVDDKPGSCPICGMDLVPKNHHATTEAADTSLAYLMKPVNEQIIASIPVIVAQKGPRTYTQEVQGRITYDTRNQRTIASRVNGRMERLLIKYNYQPVQKGQLIMEIYSPELASAQRELLFIKNSGDGGMLSSARERLMLLGMQAAEIDRVLKTEKISYKIPVYSNASGYIVEQSTASAGASNAGSAGTATSGMGMGESNAQRIEPATVSSSTSPVLIREGEYVRAGQPIFTIYTSGNLLAEFTLKASSGMHIQKGTALIIHRSSDTLKRVKAVIGLIQPTLNAGENFTMARVYLHDSGYRVGELVTGIIPITAEKGWWLPKEAVVFLGNTAVILIKDGKVFIPKQVSTGVVINGNVQVLTDISRWKIASNASYLIDSDSFIKSQKQNEK